MAVLMKICANGLFRCRENSSRMEIYMKNLTLANIAAACGGNLYLPEGFADREVSQITTDSRNVSDGALFIPIVGKRADGHSYIAQVYEKGALCTLTQRELTEEEKAFAKPYIKVADSVEAMKEIAAFYRSVLDIKVVGITGSVGKTSTKEIISAVLETKYKVLKTEGNLNNEIGVPLTIFRIREEHEVAVIEMGISDFEEMHRLSKMARPDIGVITNIGLCHLENLGSRDGVLKAKTEMFDYLNQNAVVILNGDDDKLSSIQEVQGKSPVFYSIEEECDIYADNIKPKGLSGISCTIHAGENVMDVTVPVPGRHMVYNAMAAAAVGLALHLTKEEIKKGIESMKTIGGRARIIRKDDLVIIDDCYNANPVSMKAALDILDYADTRKIAILGDMFELGEKEEELHAEIGGYLKQKQIDVVICIGKLSKNIKDDSKAMYYFDNLDSFFDCIDGLLMAGDTILVKASHGMEFARIVKYFENFF